MSPGDGRRISKYSVTVEIINILLMTLNKRESLAFFVVF